MIDPDLVTPNLEPYRAALAPAVSGATIERHRAAIAGARLVQLDFDEEFAASIAAIKALAPGAIVTVKAAIDAESHLLAERLVAAGVESITFVANHHGRSGVFGAGEFVKETFRRIHAHLMAQGVRDKVTLIAGGGIALAEHMAKIIICGADLVVVDLPFLIALECRMCMNCTLGRPCPVDIAGTPPEHGARRITNLASAWHSQLLEVLGAMGIREVRRLRGEHGRAMFQEDLERETFQALFAGKRAKGTMSTQAAITAKITRKPTRTATRFRNAIGKYKVIRTDRCIGCGKCAELCPHGVHVRYAAYSRTARPKDHLCRGTWCKENCDYYCIDKCPAGALSMGVNPVYESMGDPRWTPDMIISHLGPGRERAHHQRHPRPVSRRLRRRLRQAAPQLPEGAGERAQARRRSTRASRSTGAAPARRSSSTSPGTAAACRTAR